MGEKLFHLLNLRKNAEENIQVNPRSNQGERAKEKGTGRIYLNMPFSHNALL